MASILSNGRGKSSASPIALPRIRHIVNEDEVVIGQIPVNFVEWEEQQEQVGSRTITRRTPIQRKALINDYVPAQLYDAFLSQYDDMLDVMDSVKAPKESQSKVEGLQRQYVEGRIAAEELEQQLPAALQLEAAKADGQENSALDVATRMNAKKLQKFQDMQYTLVLAVWILTEPDMDEQRLRQGLDEDQLKGLFAHFFSKLSRQKKGKAKNGASTSPANEQEQGEE